MKDIRVGDKIYVGRIGDTDKLWISKEIPDDRPFHDVVSIEVSNIKEISESEACDVIFRRSVAGSIKMAEEQIEHELSRISELKAELAQLDK